MLSLCLFYILFFHFMSLLWVDNFFLGYKTKSFVGFKSHKVPEHLDTIIIGSGIGGLSVGALLARAGKKVLVLEQHDQAGGCCHTFHDKGFEFDTGMYSFDISSRHPSFEIFQILRTSSCENFVSWNVLLKVKVWKLPMNSFRIWHLVMYVYHG